MAQSQLNAVLHPVQRLWPLDLFQPPNFWIRIEHTTYGRLLATPGHVPDVWPARVLFCGISLGQPEIYLRNTFVPLSNSCLHLSYLG
jgi:hypothetical protein